MNIITKIAIGFISIVVIFALGFVLLAQKMGSSSDDEVVKGAELVDVVKNDIEANSANNEAPQEPVQDQGQARMNELYSEMGSRVLTQEEKEEIYEWGKNDRMREMEQFASDPGLPYLGEGGAPACESDDCLEEPKMVSGRIKPEDFERHYDALLKKCKDGDYDKCVTLYDFIERNVLHETNVAEKIVRKILASPGVPGLLDYACSHENGKACMRVTTLSPQGLARNLVMARLACQYDHAFCEEAVRMNESGVFLGFGTENELGFDLSDPKLDPGELPEELRLVRDNNWMRELSDAGTYKDILCGQDPGNKLCKGEGVPADAAMASEEAEPVNALPDAPQAQDAVAAEPVAAQPKPAKANAKPASEKRNEAKPAKAKASKSEEPKARKAEGKDKAKPAKKDAKGNQSPTNPMPQSGNDIGGGSGNPYKVDSFGPASNAYAPNPAMNPQGNGGMNGGNRFQGANNPPPAMAPGAGGAIPDTFKQDFAPMDGSDGGGNMWQRRGGDEGANANTQGAPKRNPPRQNKAPAPRPQQGGNNGWGGNPNPGGNGGSNNVIKAPENPGKVDIDPANYMF